MVEVVCGWSGVVCVFVFFGASEPFFPTLSPNFFPRIGYLFFFFYSSHFSTFPSLSWYTHTHAHTHTHTHTAESEHDRQKHQERGLGAATPRQENAVRGNPLITKLAVTKNNCSTWAEVKQPHTMN